MEELNISLAFMRHKPEASRSADSTERQNDSQGFCGLQIQLCLLLHERPQLTWEK